MKKIAILILLLLTNSVFAFDAPVNASATISSLCLSVVPSDTQTQLQFTKAFVAAETATYKVSIKLWNPQLGISDLFPCTLSFKVNQTEKTTQDFNLTSTEENVQTYVKTIDLNAGETLNVYLIHHAGHPLTTQSYLACEKQ